jgi:hypothetical protein
MYIILFKLKRSLCIKKLLSQENKIHSSVHLSSSALTTSHQQQPWNVSQRKWENPVLFILQKHSYFLLNKNDNRREGYTSKKSWNVLSKKKKTEEKKKDNEGKKRRKSQEKVRFERKHKKKERKKELIIFIHPNLWCNQ